MVSDPDLNPDSGVEGAAGDDRIGVRLPRAFFLGGIHSGT